MMSTRPTPWRAPHSLRVSTISTGPSAVPFTETGTRLEAQGHHLALVRRGLRIGVQVHASAGGALPTSSMAPPSWLMCQRLRSRL